MRQLKFKGFTLIELLIVVAIIAILAAIAVPNFLEAQIRSKVSRAKTDMRTLATALETYFVDNNTYIGSATATTADPGLTVNGSLNKSAPAVTNAAGRLTFRNYRPQLAGSVAYGMTTPVAYLTSIATDPFADTRGAVFGYFNGADAGWLAWSYGPDTDEKTNNGDIQARLATYVWPGVNQCTFESFYSPYQTNPSNELKCGPLGPSPPSTGPAYTYDPTNGTNSGRDVWRLKD